MTQVIERTDEEKIQIARTILNQLGGHKAVVMAGITESLALDSGLQFRFKGARFANKCVIKLNSKDLYDMAFYRVHRKGYDFFCDLKQSYNDVYYDQLIPLFEETTGVFLHL